MSRRPGGVLVGAGAVAAALLALGACANPGKEAVSALESDPMATIEVTGVSQSGDTVTSTGSSGATGSPATLRRDFVAADDLAAATSATAEAARSAGWTVDANSSSVPNSYTGTKTIDGRAARISITPTPDEGGGYDHDFQLELSLRRSD